MIHNDPDTASYFDINEDLYDDGWEGDCPACGLDDLVERRDVDKNGVEFTELFCRSCGYEER